MKNLLMLFCVFCSPFSVQAANFECEKKISSIETHYASISTLPGLYVTTSSMTCQSSSSGGSSSSLCSSSMGQVYLSDYAVCGLNVNFATDCNLSETASSQKDYHLVVSCGVGSKNVKMSFDLTPKQKGAITCARPGYVDDVTDVGTRKRVSN